MHGAQSLEKNTKFFHTSLAYSVHEFGIESKFVWLLDLNDSKFPFWWRVRIHLCW